MRLFIKTAAFYAIALLAVPLLFFLGLEQFLKWLDVGEQRDYFHQFTINDIAYYQENPAFIEQFYPRSLGITPIEQVFSADPDNQVLRIFLLGGSAARGFPDPNHGLSRHLEALLAAALPERSVEVINTAMTAINSHVVYQVAKDIPGRPTDLAIILVGNNEVVGPFGPGTFAPSVLSNLSLIRGLQVVKRSRLWQLLTEFRQQLSQVDEKQALRWRGMQMFTGNTVPQDDPRLDTVYSHYTANVGDAVQTLRDKGMHVILSTVPVNLRHSAPFASAHDQMITDSNKATWETHFTRGSQALKQNQWAAAEAQLRQAVLASPNHADTHFQLATALERSGKLDEANAHYQQALDFDTLRFRADSHLNAALHHLARTAPASNFTFVDQAQRFLTTSAPHSPGWNLLLEHVHFDFMGNYLLASSFARHILNTMPDHAEAPLLDPATLAVQIGYPNFTTIEAMGRLLDMVQAPPFTGQSNQSGLIDFIDRRGASLAARVGDVGELIEQRSKLLETLPNHWELHVELAALYRHQNDAAGAKKALDKVLRANPHHRQSLLLRAELLSRDRDFSGAAQDLERALLYLTHDAPLLAQTQGALGSYYLNSEQFDQGTEVLLALIDQHPLEIESVLRAYGTLIKDSVARGLTREQIRYIADLERYANDLIKSERAADYPLLNRRMAQILSIAGKNRAARAWAQRNLNPAEP